MKVTSTQKPRRKTRLLLLVIVLLLLIILTYSAFIAGKAYSDTPRVLARAVAANRDGLRLPEFSDDYQQILLRVEDPNFYNHHGVDFTTPGAGWTTITQGIVKVYFYDGFTPGVFRYRKLEQSLIAWVFNHRVDKRTQLAIFINSVYFGEHEGKEVIGFRSAARSYFQKDFSQLTRDEYISLVAMIVAPNKYSVATHPDDNHQRVTRIEHLLNGKCQPTGFADVYYEACD